MDNSTEKDSSSDSGFKCPQCSRVFTHKSTLSRHQSAVHAGNSFKCSGCGKEFDRKDSLVRHLKRGCKGANKPTFVCTICKSDKTFRDKWDLQRHMNKCTNKCPKCRKPMNESHVCQVLTVKLNKSKSKPSASSSSTTVSDSCYDIPTILADEINWAMLFHLKPESMQIFPGENTLTSSDDFRAMLEDLNVDFDVAPPDEVN